jgi:hypothetical protein
VLVHVLAAAVHLLPVHLLPVQMHLLPVPAADERSQLHASQQQMHLHGCPPTSINQSMLHL